MNLKFYTSVAKELKVKVRKFWGITLKFLEVTRKNLVGVLFSFCKHPRRLFIVKDVAPIGEQLLKKAFENFLIFSFRVAINDYHYDV